MRLLITLATVLTSAFAALCASGAAAEEPTCAPSKTTSAWTWPLSEPIAGAPPPGAPHDPAIRAGPTILRPFEPPPHRWDAGHRGVDLAGDVAEPVRAAGPGVVLYAGQLFGRGVVVIGHGVLRTSYEPVEAQLPVGAAVTLGEQVGTLDAGHCRSGACLHWGLLTGHGHATTYYDPLLLLGCGRVRLEPVIAAPRSR
ncbi:MAG TPA: peptidoglycan DD-metalloendopeptidase family protein [Actinospica sp.]|jgi:murein DD-endopeptidase MepM/ murein hydrolase activator NlpD|nr:peptidoglycan DD-metalloendopeptidase family protein [Actinospica sp.]